MITPDKKLHLWMAGPTGSGKTALISTLGRVLEQQTNRPAIKYEELDPSLNIYFNGFYQALVSGIKPNPFAQVSQDEFARHAALQSMLARRDLRRGYHVIEGGSMVNHVPYEINLKKDGHLENPEENYLKYWQFVLKTFQKAPVPHALIITMFNDDQETEGVDIQMERIKERAKHDPTRKGEVDVPREYWEQQIKYYERLIQLGTAIPLDKVPDELRAEFEKPELSGMVRPPIIVLDAKQIDWRTEIGAQVGLAYIYQHLEGLKVAS
ncbi:MAG TPA: hypothetical protein VD999_01235 [Vitreimonas sp.]|nr:hypothetical protein [Vitreimonas sp.]